MRTWNASGIRRGEVTPFVKNTTRSSGNNTIKRFELTPGTKKYLYTKCRTDFIEEMFCNLIEE